MAGSLTVPRPAPRTDPGPAPGVLPGRRAVLATFGALALGAAGCSVVAPQERTSAAPGRSSPPSTSRPPGVEGDEGARRALLSDVDDLRARIAALVGGGGGSVLVDAVGTALEEQARALTTRADAQPSTPSSPPGDASLPALVDALAAAAATASARLGRPLSGAMARLVAAVAAGHAVGADVLARASSLPGPQGLPPAGGPGGSGRPDVPAPGSTPDAGAARALSRARDVEAQARYAYGVVAVHLEGDVLAAALAMRSAHDEASTALDAALSGAPGAKPGPGPRDAWALPFAVVDDVTAATLAARVEDGCADAWADVVAATGGADRAAAATAVTVRALQGARWRYRLGRGADLTSLPGLSGRT